MRIALLALTLAFPALAQADVLRATREQPMFEVSHTVDVYVEDGVATYKVQRKFANPGTVADQAELAIDLPAGAAATGLRIRAKQRWYDGVLMERTKAAALYEHLTGMGVYDPKDPALLQWEWADKLRLQMFPVMPGTISTIEYTLTVPTRYASGRYWLSYPRVATRANSATDDTSAGLLLATPIVRVHPAWQGAVIAFDGARATADTTVVLAMPPHEPWQDEVAVEPTASYVASAITIPTSRHTTSTFTSAQVTLAITHTYKSDVRVELLAPSGMTFPVVDRTGGGDNNIRGTFKIELPPTVGAGTWRLVVSDHVARDAGSLDSWSLAVGDTTLAARDTPKFIPDAPETANDAGLAAISVTAPPIATWAARLGKVVASDKAAFARLEIDVAPQLVALPKQAQVVFAVDASFSGGNALMTAQLAVIRAYLSHVPDAEVEIIAYRRDAKRVFGRFVRASEIGKALDAATRAGAFALGNGSALDAAAQLASSILVTRTGPRRFVIATDDLLRTTLDESAALASLGQLPADVIVHVVLPVIDHDDRITLVRDDDHALAPLATKHHGIFVELRGVPAKVAKDLTPIALELVRPTRIEKLVVAGLEVTETMLHEGDGVRVFTLGKTAPSRVSLSGVLWSDPIQKDVAVTDAFSRSTAAFVFGADEHQSLTPAEQMTVAMLGRAVSPVTSYVAFEPGTRPSTIGLGGGGTGWGTIGTGRYGTIGHGSGAARVAPDLRALIDPAACIAANPPATVQLAVETTRDEIVDVAVDAGAGPLADCLVETAWRVRLTSAFDATREHFTVEFGN